MEPEYYAGIGARITPQDICDKFSAVAQRLQARGLILRSGGAKGADKAFEKGVTDRAFMDILRPRDATPAAIALASQFHGGWHNCTEDHRRLHGRNAMIIMGRELQTPARFALCWTGDEDNGGTALGIKIARAHGIPVYNLCKMDLPDFYEAIRVNLAA